MKKATPEQILAQETEVSFGPIDRARAVFRGVTIVGHRRSVVDGEMLWALPGGGIADTRTLQIRDPLSNVIAQPNAVILKALQWRAIQGEVSA